MESDADTTPHTTTRPAPSSQRQVNASAPSRHRGPPLTAAEAPIRPTATTFDSSMALTVLILLAALFFMGFFSVYIRRFADDNSVDLSRGRRRRRRRSSSSSSAGPSGTQAAPGKGEGGVDPSAVLSLPLFAYGGGAEDPIDCPVCLGEFETKEAVKAIPSCRHVFHPRCIDTWLSLHASCPLCRTTRLFPAKDGGCRGLLFGGAQGEVCLNASELERGSAAGSGDTWMENGREGIPSGVGRSSSCCPSMGDRVPSLHRTTSL